MNHILTRAMVLFLLLACATSVEARKTSEYIIPAPENVSLRHEGGNVIIHMDMLLKMIKVSNNEAAIYTPVLKFGTHELKLNSVGVYGRTRYYQYIRSTGLITGDSEVAFIRGSQPATYEYTDKINFRPWMENATLVLEQKLYECCQEMKNQSALSLDVHMVDPTRLSSEGTSEHSFYESGNNSQELDTSFFDINVISDDAEANAGAALPVVDISTSTTYANPAEAAIAIIAAATGDNSNEELLSAAESSKPSPSADLAFNEISIGVQPAPIPSAAFSLSESGQNADSSQKMPAKNNTIAGITPQYLYYKVLRSKKAEISQKDTLFIQFPNRTTALNLDYGDNTDVLDRLTRTITELKSNPNVTLRGITITNYSSPEGMIEDNQKLVSERVKSIKNYLVSKGFLSASMIKTETVPENWEGLRNYVAKHSIPNGDAILLLIDGPREPDNKEWVLKSRYADVYKSLLNDVYPELRYTTVDFDFDLKPVNNPSQDMRFLDQNGNILPLNDIFFMAQQYPEGSPQSLEIYLNAVKYYPSAFKANYNAAVALLQCGYTEEAKVYIAEAGETPDVYYTRGLIYMALGDYQTARDYMKLANLEGVPQAEVIYEHLRNKVPRAQ